MDKQVVENTELLISAISGLRDTPKSLESKWFYDNLGSALFEEITVLPEYYPTRTEAQILEKQLDVLARHIPPGTVLAELGSGASVKTRLLLDNLTGLAGYIPIDISAAFLAQIADGLRQRYPAIDVTPVVADFMQTVTLPSASVGHPKAVFFPGSTIGNLEEEDAIDLLRKVRAWPDVSAFVIGVDLIKDIDVLKRAYDDTAGTTAAFNLNILRRLNREIGACFDLETFQHAAIWNPDHSRIEMHLVSGEDQTIAVGPVDVSFAKGESIHTENSHKYSRESVAEIAAASGWHVTEFLTDTNELFAVCVLTPA